MVMFNTQNNNILVSVRYCNIATARPLYVFAAMQNQHQFWTVLYIS